MFPTFEHEILAARLPEGRGVTMRFTKPVPYAPTPGPIVRTYEPGTEAVVPTSQAIRLYQEQDAEPVRDADGRLVFGDDPDYTPPPARATVTLRLTHGDAQVRTSTGVLVDVHRGDTVTVLADDAAELLTGGRFERP